MDKGRALQFDYGGAISGATLLDERSPRTCAELAHLLPIDTTFVADMWGGQSANASILNGPSNFGESTSRVIWPGYVYYAPERSELTFCYGNASLGGPRQSTPVVPLLALSPGWRGSVLPKAIGHHAEGKRTATIPAG